MKKIKLYLESFIITFVIVFLYTQSAIAGKLLSGSELTNSCKLYAEKASRNSQMWYENSCLQKLNNSYQLLSMDYQDFYKRCIGSGGSSIEEDLEFQSKIIKECLSKNNNNNMEGKTGQNGHDNANSEISELIYNPYFKNLSYWMIHEWYKPSEGKNEVIIEPDGIRFKSTSSNNRIGILQNLNTDVSACKSLIIRANVKVDAQTLAGTGYQGREAPIAIFMSYTDETGVLHNLLSENPYDTRQRMFWHGFYYTNTSNKNQTINGTKLTKGVWYNYSTNLMNLNPKPKHIHFIGAEGAGWPMRDGKIEFLTLSCEK